MVIVALTNVIYKCIFVSLGHATWEIVSMYNRPKLRYNESRYSEFRDIVNKCQLPLLLKSHDIVNSRYSEQKEPDTIVRYIEVWVYLPRNLNNFKLFYFHKLCVHSMSHSS